MHQVALDPHGVEGAGPDTVTESEAGILAGVGTVLHHLGRGAAHDAEVLELLGHVTLDLHAAAEGDHGVGIACRLAGQLGDPLGHIRAARAALVRRGVGVVDDGRRIGFAAGETASATVGAGQGLDNHLQARVLFNGKQL